MQVPDLKALKRLADMCRKAGISHFKSAEFEFTLTEDAPQSAYKRSKTAREASPSLSTPDNSPFTTDTLSDEQLLYWSTGNLADQLDSTDKEGE